MLAIQPDIAKYHCVHTEGAVAFHTPGVFFLLTRYALHNGSCGLIFLNFCRAEKPPLKRQRDDEASASADRSRSSRNSMRRNQNIAPSAHIEEGKYTAARPMSNKAVVSQHTHVLQSRDRRMVIGPDQKGYGQSFVDISTDEDWSDEELEKLRL